MSDNELKLFDIIKSFSLEVDEKQHCKPEASQANDSKHFLLLKIGIPLKPDPEPSLDEHNRQNTSNRDLF